jgi:hypothetical protein
MLTFGKRGVAVLMNGIKISECPLRSKADIR